MSGKEIKLEIQKVLETVPDNVLQDILEYLKQIQSVPKDKIDLSKHIKTILTEDSQLLNRLAQ